MSSGTDGSPEAECLAISESRKGFDRGGWTGGPVSAVNTTGQPIAVRPPGPVLVDGVVVAFP